MPGAIHAIKAVNEIENAHRLNKDAREYGASLHAAHSEQCDIAQGQQRRRPSHPARLPADGCRLRRLQVAV